MRIVIYCISISLFIASCKKKENTLMDPSTSVSFTVEKNNSDNNYTSKVEQFIFKKKSASWRLNNFEELGHLSREIMYDLELENGENIEFGLWFGKNDNLNKDEVVLGNPNSENTLGLWGNQWQYKNFAVGVENFYRENKDIRITINNTVIFTSFGSDNIQFTNLAKATVNGEEKTYAEFEFEGTAYGWYDPNGEFSEYFKITNGSFKGIID